MDELEKSIEDIEQELKSLNDSRKKLLEKLIVLRQRRIPSRNAPAVSDDNQVISNEITCNSSKQVKIALFRSLFKGREDVFPKRFESSKTGKSGYQPVCNNQWVAGVCKKPTIKCSDCFNQNYVPVSDKIVRNHLTGHDPESREKADYVIGVYPLLENDTCHFLAVDFDGENWKTDASAFLQSCRDMQVPCSLERSRSGNGGHIWIFFDSPISAVLARKLGSSILTKAMSTNPEIKFTSYDRFFPNQDFLPRGGFGNLIALPLQKKSRENGNSIFIGDDFEPYKDQWLYLGRVQKISSHDIEKLIATAVSNGEILGVQSVADDECEEPWNIVAKGKATLNLSYTDVPDKVTLTMANQIFIEKDGLPPKLLNALIRLAAFQNSEFYKAQKMRLPTYNKPRIIDCHENFTKHIGLPRGCRDEVVGLLESLSIKVLYEDKTTSGIGISADFHGTLTDEQEKAVSIMLHYENGILSAPTAFGKTIVAIAILAARKVNTIILVHRVHLAEQWVRRLSEFLQIPKEEIGLIGGGKKRITSRIDVAVIQSMSRNGPVNDMISDYSQVIVDECHHLSAFSFDFLVKQAKARYFLGLSATVTRKDGHHPIVLMNVGPIRYTVKANKYADESSFNHFVIVRRTDSVFAEMQNNNSYSVITNLYSLLARDEERNALIVEDVVSAVSEGRSPLVLTERREHQEILFNLLSAKLENVMNLEARAGKKSKLELQNKIDGIAPEEPRVLISTGKYIGEGFDDARLDTLFLTMPVSWKGTIAQYAGRLHRKYQGKRDVIIYDYVDKSSPILLKMFSRRVSGYRSIGYTVEG